MSLRERDLEILKWMLEKPGFYLACQRPDGRALQTRFAEEQFSTRRNEGGSAHSESESSYLVIYEVLDELQERDRRSVNETGASRTYDVLLTSPNSGTPVSNKVAFPPPVPLTKYPPAGDVLNDRPPAGDPTTSPTAPSVSTSLAPTIGKQGPPTSDPASDEQSTDDNIPPHPLLPSVPDVADFDLGSSDKPNMDADSAELVFSLVRDKLESVVSEGMDYEAVIAARLEELQRFESEKYLLEWMVERLREDEQEAWRRGFVFIVFAIIHDEL